MYILPDLDKPLSHTPPHLKEGMSRDQCCRDSSWLMSQDQGSALRWVRYIEYASHAYQASPYLKQYCLGPCDRLLASAITYFIHFCYRRHPLHPLSFASSRLSDFLFSVCSFSSICVISDLPLVPRLTLTASAGGADVQLTTQVIVSSGGQVSRPSNRRQLCDSLATAGSSLPSAILMDVRSVSVR